MANSGEKKALNLGAKMGNHLDWMLRISYLFLISHNRMVAEKEGQLVKIGPWLQACNTGKAHK